MKLTNKNLAILSGVLVALFITTRYFKKNNNKNLLDTTVIAIDTTMVSKFEIIKPLNKEAPITCSRASGTWEVTQNNITGAIKSATLKNTLTQLKNLKVTRLVTKSKDAWKKYQLADTMATKVRITQNGTSKELYLGKIKFNPPTGQRTYNSQKISGGTYFRVDDSPNVYFTEGMLSNDFNRPFNAWRNNDFAKLKKEDISQIRFKYLDGKSFVLQKKDSLWSIDEQLVDTNKVHQYLRQLSNKSNNNFNDSYTAKTAPDYQITVLENSAEMLTIKSYKDSLAPTFYLKSSQNPKVFFESDTMGIQKELFVDQHNFATTIAK